jgi:hypothetical protein
MTLLGIVDFPCEILIEIVRYLDVNDLVALQAIKELRDIASDVLYKSHVWTIRCHHSNMDLFFDCDGWLSTRLTAPVKDEPRFKEVR